jgi:hypothetical protein
MRHPIRTARRGDEGGFALILAILALMLLTTMGITLSLTTSTELQVANNYKWSQQALYNAEAGIEAGKRLLQTMDWSTILPPPRGGSWFDTDPASPPNVPFPGATRDVENGSCDGPGRGVGYGVVLADGMTTYENVDTVWGQSLRGAFTLWIRRPLILTQEGKFSDTSADDNSLVLTSEGTAPFSTSAGAGAFVMTSRAVRVMEWTLSRELKQCGARQGQGLGDPSGGGPGACKSADDDTAKKLMAAADAQMSGADFSAGTGNQVDAAAN